MDLDSEYSGATPPAGAAPWLNATFDDGGSPGSVTLTLSTPGLTDPEFVRRWLFNLDPLLNPTLLSFSAPLEIGSFAAPTIYTGVDTFKAGGDGYFDIKFAFSNSGGPNRRFGAGDAAIYTVTGIPTLAAASFNFESVNGPGPRSFRTVAHVQGINDEDSGWVAPEPATMALLAMGSLALLRRRCH